MKTKILISTIIIVLSGSLVWNKIQFNKHSRNYEKKINTSNLKVENMTKIIHSLKTRLHNTLKHSATRIKLKENDIKNIFTYKKTRLLEKSYPRLLMVFSEFNCDVCQDEETKFANEIAETFGSHHVIAMIQATRKYLINYIRMNQVKFDVFFSINDNFFNENNIKVTPAVFLLDKNNRVIKSFFPFPGEKEFSTYFHKYCTNFFYNYYSKKKHYNYTKE